MSSMVSSSSLHPFRLRILTSLNHFIRNLRFEALGRPWRRERKRFNPWCDPDDPHPPRVCCTEVLDNIHHRCSLRLGALDTPGTHTHCPTCAMPGIHGRRCCRFCFSQSCQGTGLNPSGSHVISGLGPDKGATAGSCDSRPHPVPRCPPASRHGSEEGRMVARGACRNSRPAIRALTVDCHSSGKPGQESGHAIPARGQASLRLPDCDIVLAASLFAATFFGAATWLAVIRTSRPEAISASICLSVRSGCQSRWR